MTSPTEIAEKERRARAILAEQKLSALSLSSQANFAWITCGGDNHVSIASDGGVASAVITPNGKFIVCDSIEAGRIADEEKVEEQGYRIESWDWWEDKRSQTLERLAGGGQIGSDLPMPGARVVEAAIKPYRAGLTSEEIERYRWVGGNAAECIAEACRKVKPGMTELKIAAILDKKVISRGMIPNVTLVAADDRISKYRHPIPTEKQVENYAMLVLGARKWGLVVSVTRLVGFGPVGAEIRRRHQAVCEVDAAFIAATRPGINVGEVFRKGQAAYARTGFADEWKLHHQGGPTGYLPREYRAGAETQDTVKLDQAYAWNPSITGTKSEDTIIAREAETEIISMSPDWPMVSITVDGLSLPRPDILEL